MDGSCGERWNIELVDGLKSSKICWEQGKNLKLRMKVKDWMKFFKIQL